MIRQGRENVLKHPVFTLIAVAAHGSHTLFDPPIHTLHFCTLCLRCQTGKRHLNRPVSPITLCQFHRSALYQQQVRLEMFQNSLQVPQGIRGSGQVAFMNSSEEIELLTLTIRKPEELNLPEVTRRYSEQ